MAEPKDIELGFVEKTDDWLLLSHFFPSKVGGKPAWLSLKPLPRFDDLKCGVCGKPCVFLLQAYAPRSDLDTCFHRTILLFMCKDPACSKRNDSANFIVIRSQLPRENEFYPSEAPDEDRFDSKADYPRASKLQDLCVVCGVPGPKKCSGCHTLNYCSKEHQTLDWKAGHKLKCTLPEGPENKSSLTKFLFNEYDLVMEPEEYKKGKVEKSEEERMEEYKKFMKTDRAKSMMSDKDMGEDLKETSTEEMQIDKQFQRFKKRIEHEPEQVLRYDVGGKPLWVSNEHVAKAEDIPKCSCGAEREFEFQVLPQLLHYLHVDSPGGIDWGTLAVYLCKNSCDIGNNYHREFLWKQDISEKSFIPKPK